MRNTILLLGAFLFILLIESCQKEVSFDTGTNPSLSGDMRAKIDGQQWVSGLGASAHIAIGRIAISGLSVDRKIILLNVVDSGVHRYTLNNAALNFAVYQDSAIGVNSSFGTEQSDDPNLAGGEVNITKIDTVNKKISGTFSFKAYREDDGAKKNITDGSFTDITYTTTIPPSTGSDTFRVKIDGTPFNPAVITGQAAFGLIQIGGSSVTYSPSVSIAMPADIAPGTYTFGQLGLTGNYNNSSDPLNVQSSNSGNITILEHNSSTKRIRGNFDFLAQSLFTPSLSSTLTEGYFSIKYQ